MVVNKDQIVEEIFNYYSNLYSNGGIEGLEIDGLLILMQDG